MSEYVVSARKYRPSTFKTVVGQEIITTTLKNSIKNKQLAHAYLFCGPRGVGKTTCARIFAKTINCFNPTPDYEPCNTCQSCVNFNKNALFNIHELDAASNNSVDSMRELINQVRIPPQLGKYSVFIIDEVHMLTKDAFNAFLKTLEEPPSHAIFIMATTEKHKIIPTILSRCQVFDFKRIQLNDIVTHLEHIAQHENIEFEKEALIIIAQKADGSMRDALSIFDQMASFSENHITYEKVIKNLNVLDYEYYFKLTSLFLSGNTSEVLLIFNEILNNGFDSQYFISGLAEHFRNLMLCKDTKTIPLLEVSENIARQYAEQANACNVNFLFEALKIINEVDIQYKTSYNKRFLVELMLYRLCYIQQANTSPVFNTTNTTVQTSNIVQNSLQQETKTTIKETTSTQNYQQATNTSTTIVKETDTTIKQPTNKMPSGISIKMSKIDSENIVKGNTEATITEKQETFTVEKAIEVWNKFIEQPNTNSRIKNLYSELPNYAKWEEQTLKLKVPNKSLETDIRKIHDELLAYLKNNLNNNSIKIEIIQTDEEIKTSQPYTDKEKFLYFEQHFPLLKEIKNQFDLDFL